MTQIADAPWIREAEMYGMPPYDENPEFEYAAECQAKEMSKADELADSIVDILLGAEDALLGYEESCADAKEINESIREMIYKVEDLGCDLRSLRRKLNGERR